MAAFLNPLFKTCAVLFAVCCFLSACQTEAPFETNARLDELERHMVREGIVIDGVGIGADINTYAKDGRAFRIDDATVIVLFYDMSVEAQKRHFEYIKKEGTIYVRGFPYPVVCNGPYVLCNVNKHRNFETIAKAFSSFR